MIGIYKITNKLNNKSYIGQSIDIEKRWAKHRCSNIDAPLYNDFKQFGLSNFTFEVLTECKKEELNSLEKFYIQKFKSTNPKFGYNQTIGGGIYGHGLAFNYDSFYELINDLQNTTLSKDELAEKYQCTERAIRDINNGISWHQDDIHYPIRPYFVSSKDNHKYFSRYAPIEAKSSHCKYCGAIICTGATICKKCYDSHRPNTKINRNELSDLLTRYKITEVAKMYNVSHTTVRRWCKKFNIAY